MTRSVMPAKAGISWLIVLAARLRNAWIPVATGMTEEARSRMDFSLRSK